MKCPHCGKEITLDDLSLHDAMAEWGRIGGKIGGFARAQKLSKEERSTSARRAVQERWRKYKRNKKEQSEGGA